MAAQLRRREVLAAAAAAAAAACSSHRGGAQPTSAPGGQSGAPHPSTGDAAASGVSPSTTTVAASTTVDRSALNAKYASAAPTQWGMDLACVARRVADRSAPTVALTFDACGGPHADGIDQRLVDLLRREQVPATLFLNARWVGANTALAQDLANDPLFEIGNHGTRHVPLSVTGRSAYGIAGTRSIDEVVDEVWFNHVALSELTGRAPRWFRSGTAHYDEVATAIVSDLGELPVGFVVNGDAGATFTPAQVRREVSAPATAGGAVVIMHMIRPSGGTAEGLTAALPELRARGARFVTLSGGGGATTG